MATTPTPSRRRADGERRQAILEEAARLATVEGLEGLSIGRLASAVGMSKSGLYAHFKSKLELQLATIETADTVFRSEVVGPGLAAPAGTARVLALCDAFLSHVERRTFPGGCFFAAVAAEMNVRPGPVRDRIGEFVGGWMGAIEGGIREAQSLGEISAGADPSQLAFETNAMLIGANLAFPLFGDPGILERARVGVRERLRGAA
ncbi:MAG TPA: TetR/AcrR family transcriptional regulator [Gaiellales bacterium]